MKKLQDEFESLQQIDVAEEIMEESSKATIESIEAKIDESIDETVEAKLKTNLSILESLYITACNHPLLINQVLQLFLVCQ